MARLVGDQLQQHEPKLAGFEHPPAPAAAASAPALRAVAEVEMKRAPIALPAAPAAHREQALGNVDLEPPARAATMMSMSHKFSFDVSKIYLSCIAGKRRTCNFRRASLCFRAQWPTCSPTRTIAAKPPEAPPANAPLADRLRPRSLGEIVGQEHLTGPDGAIGRMVAAGRLASMILWGPPGTGKTSIARLLADAVGLRFVAISAVFSGVADLKKIFAEARQMAKAGQQTLLFVDEVHRFNRSQQDGFLPYVEDGTVTLVGATTENPSFELNAALLSRCQVLILRRLDHEALEELVRRAEALEGRPLPVTAEAREALIASADGDGRFLLNQVETLFSIEIDEPLGPAELSELLHRRVPVYDKDREGHYNLISALHKIASRLGPAGVALLSRADARRRRGAALRAPPPGPLRARRTSASPIPMPWSSASRPRTATTSSVRPRARWRSSRPASISRPRPNRTPLTSPRRAPGEAPGRPAR